MTSLDLPNLDNKRIDYLTAIAKGTFGMIPGIGSFAAELLGIVIPNQRIERATKLLTSLAEKLTGLENEYWKTTMKHEKSIDILEEALEQSIRATSDERIEHLANIVVNGFSKEEVEYAVTKRMLWLLRQLEDEEVVILRGIAIDPAEETVQNAEFRKKHYSLLNPPEVTIGCDAKVFDDIALSKSYRRHLEDLELLSRQYSSSTSEDKLKFDRETGKLHAKFVEVSRLGLLFLKHLGLIAEVSTEKRLRYSIPSRPPLEVRLGSVFS